MHNTNIICLGDSFTRGFGVRKKENWISQAYPENTTLINAGINGDTTSGMLARFSRDVIEHRPDYVLITGGINDFIVGSSLDIPKNNYCAEPTGKAPWMSFYGFGRRNPTALRTWAAMYGTSGQGPTAPSARPTATSWGSSTGTKRGCSTRWTGCSTI